MTTTMTGIGTNGPVLPSGSASERGCIDEVLAGDLCGFAPLVDRHHSQPDMRRGTGGGRVSHETVA
ncbi:MAG TPA: hypothetical protein VHZ06_04200 [Marmoricola sp.]|jgi:hypothetical protein|nr:hypothetical protein [Marmoricola sp.]